MKTKLVLALATALGTTVAFPQDERRPEPPRPPGGDHREPLYRPEMRPLPFMGVMTAPLPSPMAAQLGLPEGFGLLVQEVVPESPAAIAGLQRYDILKLLDDQQLVDPNQLAALVRGKGQGAEVAFTVLRKGQEQKVTVKVGERMMPEDHAFGSGIESPRDFDRMRGQLEEKMRHLQEQMQQRGKEFQDRMRKFQERMKEWQKDPNGPAPEVPNFGDNSGPPAPAPHDLRRERRRDDDPAARPEADGKVTTRNSAHAHASLKDESGEVEVDSNNGARTLVAEDAEGKTIFSGPIDTEEQRKALPVEVRKKLEQIHVR